MTRIILFSALLLAACGATEVTETTTTSTTTTTTTIQTANSAATSAPTSTTTTTTTPTLGTPTLVEHSAIGVWPYRTAEEVLAAAVDGTEQDPVALVQRFVEDYIGWTVIKVEEAFEGPTLMGYDLESSGGPISVMVRVVAFTPGRDAVWSIDFASSLDPLDATWGPSTDIAESEEGWSALIGGTPIESLTDQPGVTGPFAQLHYGEWESNRERIGLDGVSIPIPIAPDIPGVLSVWYINADDSVAGFSVYALPPGPFVAG